jgi:hypothetical protein
MSPELDREPNEWPSDYDRHEREGTQEGVAMSNFGDPVEPTQEQVSLIEERAHHIFARAIDSAVEHTMMECKHLVGGNMSIDAAMVIINRVAKEEVARLWCL